MGRKGLKKGQKVKGRRRYNFTVEPQTNSSTQKEYRLTVWLAILFSHISNTLYKSTVKLPTYCLNFRQILTNWYSGWPTRPPPAPHPSNERSKKIWAEQHLHQLQCSPWSGIRTSAEHNSGSKGFIYLCCVDGVWWIGHNADSLSNEPTGGKHRKLQNCTKKLGGHISDAVWGDYGETV